jgi:hypothetical protein
MVAGRLKALFNRVLNLERFDCECSAGQEETDLNIDKILNDLRQEREQFDEVILSLERLALGRARRRGRPPAWIALAKSAQSNKSRAQPVIPESEHSGG